MCTYTEAQPNFGWATYSSASFNTATDAYRFAASYSSATPVTTRGKSKFFVSIRTYPKWRAHALAGTTPRKRQTRLRALPIIRVR